MGTPHRGSQSMADLGNDVRRVASILLRFDSNDKIITALVDGPELELGRTEFRRLWNKYKFRVKTFQEAKALTGVNVGVMNELVRYCRRISQKRETDMTGRPPQFL
jgi:hypothetical protein